MSPRDMEFYHGGNVELLSTIESQPNPSSWKYRFWGKYDPQYVQRVVQEKTEKSFSDNELGQTLFLLEDSQQKRYTEPQMLKARTGYDHNLPLKGIITPPSFKFHQGLLRGYTLQKSGESVSIQSYAEVPHDIRLVRTRNIEELNFLLGQGFSIHQEEKKTEDIRDCYDGAFLGTDEFKLYTLISRIC